VSALAELKGLRRARPGPRSAAVARPPSGPPTRHHRAPIRCARCRGSRRHVTEVLAHWCGAFGGHRPAYQGKPSPTAPRSSGARITVSCWTAGGAYLPAKTEPNPYPTAPGSMIYMGRPTQLTNVSL